jgi:hypothetical protein
MRIQPFVPSLLSLCLLTGAASAQAAFPDPYPAPADRAAGATAVSVDDTKRWLGTLAGPEFEGRGTGQPGFQKAADYVAAHFAALGLVAMGKDGSYFQHVPWGTAKVDTGKTFVTFHRDGNEVLRIPAERLAGTATASLSAEGDVVFLVVTPPPRSGEARTNRQLEVPTIPGLDAVDVAGKVVVVHLRATDEGRGAIGARFAVRQAFQGKQPAAVLFADREAPTTGLRGRAGAGRGAGNPAVAGMRRSPLDATFGGQDLDALLAAGGVAADALQGATLQPPITLRAKVEVVVAEEQVPAMNVFAVLPGRDAKLRDEHVVVGSHLDHLGVSRGQVHPGADDDASGTTGVMAVAQMLAKNPLRPARSVLFVCFCGEENGLIGSDFFAKNCPVPLSSIVAELQLDMIGRDEEQNREGNRGEQAADNRTSVHLVGTQKLAPSLHELCLRTNERAGLQIEYDQEGMFGRSDHANFAKMGVPIAFFFTGLHRDYHETTDTPDKIHYEKLLRIATWVYDLAFELGTQSGRPEVDPTLWQKYRGKASEQPAAPLAVPVAPPDAKPAEAPAGGTGK